ncbi:phosphotransferase family protein [Mycolicibacterium sp.]|uniref:phosphotransferase family protein n=1 Tax=Mycolicibacterium sp. TaxID=2320850 RepID=UPI0037CABC2C
MSDSVIADDWQRAPTKLSAYLSARLHGDASSICLKPISGGRSYVTYWLRIGDQLHVLRQAPPASDLPTAHDIEREYELLRALDETTPVNVAKPLLLCTDRAVFGSPFMVMSKVDGFTLSSESDGAMLSIEERSDASRCFVDQLAALHSVAKPTPSRSKLPFLHRQVDRWLSQWQHAQALHPPELNRRFLSLAAAIRGSAQLRERPTLVHGDYRFDNVILRRVAGSIEVAAVIDWEMATYGDPLVDLGYTLASWTEVGDAPDRSDLPVGRRVSAHPGFMTRADLQQYYAESRGVSLPDMTVYEAFGFLKLAAIFAGINRLGFRQSQHVDRQLTRHVDRLITNGHRLIQMNALN